MAWYKNIGVWIVIAIVLVLLFFLFFTLRKNKNNQLNPNIPTASTPLESSDTTSDYQMYSKDYSNTTSLDSNISDDTTPINFDDTEDFGMYESGMATWFAKENQNHMSQNYQYHKKPKFQIKNIHTVNTNISPQDNDIEYDENNRFQTPTLHINNINPTLSRYIRPDNELDINN